MSINQMNISKIGFNLGWDYAAYSMKYPELPDGLRKQFMDGFSEASIRLSPKNNDRFIRKWLHLRRNAYTRKRIFDENVNPDLIKNLDVSHCPVTKQKLTHGTGLDSDWSFDRVVNDGGYASGNLIVVSVKANRAKANKNLIDVMDIVEGKLIDNAMTMIEWRRWLFILSLSIPSTMDNGELGLQYMVSPCIIRPPTGLPVPPAVIMQMSIAYKATNHKIYSGAYQLLLESFNKPLRQEFNSVLDEVKKMRGSLGSFDVLELWSYQKPFIKFCKAYEKLGVEFSVKSSDPCLKKLGYQKSNNMFSIEKWQVNSNGYLVD